MKKLLIILALALLWSTPAQAEPVIEYELVKDHNFYHVTLRWYDVSTEYATLYLNGGEWVTYRAWYGKTTFYTTRTRRNQPKTFFICEAGTDICSDPVTLNFKHHHPINGNNKP